ncbi:MAG: hypothetical protein ACRYG7_06715 [Janthinobacterium lividum]
MPLLDCLDIRLGFIPKTDLTVAPGKRGLKTLRERIDHRDAEDVSRALVVLRQAVANNEKVLAAKSYSKAEEKELVRM